MGLADVRRLWPQILEAVKTKRRFAWIMLSQNAQVIAIDEQTITLGLINAGARESFARSGSDEILRQAMIDTIGLTRKVEAVVDPSTDPGAAAASQPSAPPAAQSPSAPAGTGASNPQSSAGPQGVAPPRAQPSAAAQPTTQVAASISASAPTTQVPSPVQVSASRGRGCRRGRAGQACRTSPGDRSPVDARGRSGSDR
jgi:DNA polymerase-3 subunit gamma/tau